MRATGSSAFRSWTATTIACAVLAAVMSTARPGVADPVQPDPLGLVFCNRGSALQTPIGIEPPSPITPGSCARTQTDDYTVVGGYYDTQCGTPGASSMQEHSVPGYEDGTASLGFAPGHFGSLAAASENAGHGGYAGARTWGYIADELTIGGAAGSGTLHVPLHVTGSVYVYATRMNGVEDPIFHAGISVQCIDSTSPITTCNGILLDFSNQSNLPDMPTPVDQTIDMTIPFTFGTPVDFAIYACSVATMAADTALGGVVSVDFSHTGIVEKATVLDGLGQEVPGATIASVSGFDYLSGPAGPGSTTTTTVAGGSTTSTTLAPCSAGGLEGVTCLLGSLPPAACANDSLPTGFASRLGKAGAATTAAFHESRAGRRRHLLRKLHGLLGGADRIAAKASRRKKAPISTGCAAAIHAVLTQAEGLVDSVKAAH